MITIQLEQHEQWTDAEYPPRADVDAITFGDHALVALVLNIEPDEGRHDQEIHRHLTAREARCVAYALLHAAEQADR